MYYWSVLEEFFSFCGLDFSQLSYELLTLFLARSISVKAAFHSSADTADRSWHSPLQLSYPKEHLRVFRGDLVDNTPDIHQVQIAEDGCFDEFLLIASDGLWVSSTLQAVLRG